MDNNKKILLALDGSEQAMDIVRYAGSIFSPDHNELVLFHVEVDIPESFRDMGNGPDFNFQTQKIRAWMSEHRKVMKKSMEDAQVEAGY